MGNWGPCSLPPFLRHAGSLVGLVLLHEEKSFPEFRRVAVHMPPRLLRYLIGRALALAVLACVISAEAKSPDDTQARLNDWIKGKPGGIAVVWVDADGPE